MSRLRWLLALPLKLYILIGTALYFLLFKLEQWIARLGNNTAAPYLDRFKPQEWHVRGAGTAVAFPILVPILVVRDVILLVYAVIVRIVAPVGRFGRQTIFKPDSALPRFSGRVASTVGNVWEDTIDPADGSVKARMPTTSDVRQTIAAGRTRAGAALKGIRKRAGSVAGSAGKRVSSVASSATDRAGDVLDSARDRIRETGESLAVGAGESEAKPETAPVTEEAARPTAAVTKTEPAPQPVTAGAVNVNQATVEQLTELPGIGPALAQRIVDYRQENGPFADSKALSAVSGVGASLLKKLDGLIDF